MWSLNASSLRGAAFFVSKNAVQLPKQRRLTVLSSYHDVSSGRHWDLRCSGGVVTCRSLPVDFQRRAMSSNNNKNRRFKLDGLPFSVSPEDALEAFRRWAEDDQGLRYIMSYSSVRIGAAYVPLWSFDLNIRFKQASGVSSSQAPSTWKPPMFSVYDRGTSKQNTIFVPGLASYAGYSYRRSLINPVHSTSLVFLGDQTQPFGGWMLKDMKLAASGYTIEVVPDAWNATRGRAFSVVRNDLQVIVNDAWSNEYGDDVPPPRVQTQVVTSRRVMMPTYVVDYSIFGLSYRAFVSGCDRSAPVSGVSHQLFGSNNLFESPEFHQGGRNFLTQIATGAQQFVRQFNLPMLLWIFRPFVTFLWFVFLRLFSVFPIVGALGGAFAGFRKVVQPWMDTRRASADWERERDHEAQMSEDKDNDFTKDDFDDVSGMAQSFFFRNKTQILRSLSGEYDHAEGDYDWYADWTSWAQQQWTRQQQQQQQQQANQHQYQQQQQRQEQQYQQRQQAKPKDEFHWDFDPNDPYSVLGIKRGATAKEVSDAFRKNMLKYHPDAMPNASDAQKHRANERSKLITEAYQKIKKELKGNR